MFGIVNKDVSGHSCLIVDKTGDAILTFTHLMASSTTAMYDNL